MRLNLGFSKEKACAVRQIAMVLSGWLARDGSILFSAQLFANYGLSARVLSVDEATQASCSRRETARWLITANSA